jgi:hypothetical protein
MVLMDMRVPGRFLFTARGLILAGTLMLAIAGSYLVQESAASVVGVTRGQVPAQANIAVLCTPFAPTYKALPCE